MLDIEVNLKNDATGEYKKELISKFSATEMDVRSEINKGVSPDDYTRLSKLLEALEIGAKVIEKY